MKYLSLLCCKNQNEHTHTHTPHTPPTHKLKLKPTKGEELS